MTTPPPRSLGIHALEDRADGLVGCGEEIEVQGQSFVVDQVVKRYELRRGKYVRSHSRLDVQPSGRYFLNRQLEGLLEGEDADKGRGGCGAMTDEGAGSMVQCAFNPRRSPSPSHSSGSPSLTARR